MYIDDSASKKQLQDDISEAVQDTYIMFQDDTQYVNTETSDYLSKSRWQQAVEVGPSPHGLTSAEW